MLQVPPLVDPVRNAPKPRTPPTIEGVLAVSPYPRVHRKEQEDREQERGGERFAETGGQRRTASGQPTARQAPSRRDSDRTDDDAPSAPRDPPSLGIDEYA